MSRLRSPVAAYIASAALAGLSSVIGLFALAAHNIEPSPLLDREQVRNVLFNFSFYCGLFWVLGLVWSLPFRKVAQSILENNRFRPAIVYGLAGAGSGLSGVGAALWLGSSLSGDLAPATWLSYCLLVASSGLLAGMFYSWCLRRQQLA